jgi:hypothetical protein
MPPCPRLRLVGTSTHGLASHLLVYLFFSGPLPISHLFFLFLHHHSATLQPRIFNIAMFLLCLLPRPQFSPTPPALPPNHGVAVSCWATHCLCLSGWFQWTGSGPWAHLVSLYLTVPHLDELLFAGRPPSELRPPTTTTSTASGRD